MNPGQAFEPNEERLVIGDPPVGEGSICPWSRAAYAGAAPGTLVPRRVRCFRAEFACADACSSGLPSWVQKMAIILPRSSSEFQRLETLHPHEPKGRRSPLLSMQKVEDYGGHPLHPASRGKRIEYLCLARSTS